MSETIVLTPTAARRIHQLSAEEGRTVMLRVAVEGGGCSGFQYQFDLVETPEADDSRIECDGAAAVVDSVSAVLLKGSQIDFVDEIAGAGFRIRHPHARSSCGCGVSFSV
jgi:iron-sulfur cluster insertion protein